MNSTLTLTAPPTFPPDIFILDSLARSEKRPVFEQKSSVQENITRLQKRAGRKRVSIPLHIQLAELGNQRAPYYRSTVYCAEYLIQEPDGRICTCYCNGRLCAVCQPIRAAKAQNKYGPCIKMLEDPHFLTLTVRSVKASNLAQMVERMCSEFSLTNKTLKKQGIRIHGLRKLEVTCNPLESLFNPHFHCILEGSDTANAVLEQWLKRNKAIADIQAQDIKQIEADDQAALQRVFGYITKLVTPYEQNNVPVPVEDLDTIVAALYSRRALQPYGFFRESSSKIDCEEVSSEPIYYSSPHDAYTGSKVYWDWEQDARMWLNRDTGELLVPPFS